jgi:hypothetical protein
MTDNDIAKVKEQLDEILLRLETLEARVSFTEDYVREQEVQKELAENPGAERSFRHT